MTKDKLSDQLSIRQQIDRMRSEAHQLYWKAAQLEEQLAKITDPSNDSWIMHQIALEVCVALRVNIRLLFSDSREQHVAIARGVCAYIVRDIYDWSFPRIGRALDRDHTSIIHLHRLIQKRMEKFAEFAATVTKLRDQADARLATLLEDTDVESTHDSTGTHAVSTGIKVNHLQVAAQAAAAGLQN